MLRRGLKLARQRKTSKAKTRSAAPEPRGAVRSMSYFSFCRSKSPFPLFYTCVVPQPDGFDKPGRWLIFFSFSLFMRKREGSGEGETTANSCQLWVWSPRKRTQRGDGIKLNSWLKFTRESMGFLREAPRDQSGRAKRTWVRHFHTRVVGSCSFEKIPQRFVGSNQKRFEASIWRFVQFVQHTTGLLTPLNGPVKGMGNGFQREK